VVKLGTASGFPAWEKMLNSYDKDGNGKITAKEFGAVEARRFAEVDQKGTGFITKEAYQKWKDHFHNEFATKLPDWINMSDIFDLDIDGKISSKEFGQVEARRFDQIDVKHSGTITKDDYTEWMKRVTEAPTFDEKMTNMENSVQYHKN
jgi:Ca2+-binding EF-hand superfamily protein